MIRIGILGVAHLHVDAYISNLRAAGAEVVGAYDRDGERARRWCSQHAVPHFADAEALLGSAVDGVLICAETAYHLELAAMAARSGVAVLCEKPLGVSRGDSEAIVHACADAGVLLMTAFPLRYHPAVREARRLVQAGDIGRVRAFAGTNQSVMPMRERSWFADPRLAGGGAMMDHIVHLADVFCWIADAVPDDVYAVANRIVHADVVTVETAGLVVARFPDGVFASIDCSWNRPLSYPRWGDARLRVIGETGSIEVDPMRQRLTQFGGSQTFGWVPFASGMNQSLIDEFLGAIREGRPPAITGHDGLVATLIAIAALESAASGTVVPVMKAITGDAA